jgi:hypothetical protein
MGFRPLVTYVVFLFLITLPVFYGVSDAGGVERCFVDFDGISGRLEFLKCENLSGKRYEIDLIKGKRVKRFFATDPRRIDFLPFAVPRYWSGRITLKVKRDGVPVATVVLKATKPPSGLREINFPVGVVERFSPDCRGFEGKKTGLGVDGEYRLVRKILKTYTPVRFYEKRAVFPLPYYKRVSSPFGVSRVIMGKREWFHKGVDLAAPYGTPVLASLSGRVMFAGYLTLTGNTVIINHGWGLMTLYAHMSTLCVKKGQFVKQGEVIGRVGSTGFSTGPHLHFGVYLMDTAVDPLDFLRKQLRP